MTTPLYQVQKILEEALIDSRPHYLIKWKGYSSVESTWEPIENLIDALDLVHSWKAKNSPHSAKRDSMGQPKDLPKTKKIHGKQHEAKQKQLQGRLNQKSKRKPRNYDLCSEESLSLDSSLDLEKDMETGEYSFGEKPAFSKSTRSKSFEKEKSLTKGSTPASKGKGEDLSGFKVVGRVTKDVIKAVLWCFDWQQEKICEVELKDGRKVNMKKEDVKKICPEKLVEYYEKLERVKL